MVGLLAAISLQSIPLGAVSFAGLMFVAHSYKMSGSLFFNFNLVGACQNILKEADEMVKENYAYNLKKKTGALDFLTSPENGGVDAKLSSWDGGRKIGKLEVFYDQRTKTCQINHNPGASVCDDGSTPLRKNFTVTIDKFISTPVRYFTNEEMVVLCKDMKSFIRDRVFGQDLRAARESWSAVLLAELDNMIGKNYEFDGTSTAAGVYKDLDLIAPDGTSTIPLPGNFAEMILDYENNQLTGVPAVIGQGNFKLFWKLHGMSCCNATTPYGDANIEGDVRFYEDQAANTVLGASKVIVLPYGVAKLVTFNENRNISINTEIEQHFVVPDPMGYPFDWNVDFYFDKCDKLWKYMLSVHWTAFNIYQEDSFAGAGEDSSPDVSPDCGDELDGMKAVFGYRIT